MTEQGKDIETGYREWRDAHPKAGVDAAYRAGWEEADRRNGVLRRHAELQLARIRDQLRNMLHLLEDTRIRTLPEVGEGEEAS